MIFQSVVSYFLDKYLSDYIENLDTKKLKLDLWQGNVVLENLHLKSDILARFNLPVTIKTGYLRKLSLHIAWKHFYAHPIKIVIDGFYVLAELKTDVKYNPEQAERKQYNGKMKEVHKVEEFRKEKEEFERAKKAPRDQDTYFERLRLHIMRNLEVSISNIHLAFEDTTTKVDHPFTFGITLNYVKFQTTNSEWEHVTSTEDAAVVYKLGELNALSMYWNSNVKLDSSEKPLVEGLHGNITRHGGAVIENMTYILQPSNMEAKLQIASVPGQQDYARPVLDVKSDLGQIHLNVNRNQYTDLLDLLEHWDHIKLQSKYIRYYEMIETDKPSLKRWQFAYAAIVNEVVRPHLSYHKWENIRANLDRCREYRTLYFKELNDQATKQEKQRARELEKQLDVLNLVFIRRNAELEVKKKTVERKRKSTWGWLSDWWTNYSDTDNKQDLDQESVMTVDEEMNLSNAIHDNDGSSASPCPEEYVDMDLSIRLNLLEINVWSNLNENDPRFELIAQIAVSNTTLRYQQRPATSAFLATIDIEALEMYGAAVENKEDHDGNITRPNIIHLADKSELSSQQLLHVEFETNPANTNIDYRIHATSQSVEIIYDAITMNRLVDCFYPDVYRDLKGVKKKIYSMYMDIRHRIQFLLNYNLRHIKNLDIAIDLKSVYFLVPEDGVYRNHNCSIACLDLGHFTAQGNRHEIDQIDEEIFEDAQSDRDMIDSSYIPIIVRLKDIRFLYANSHENWKTLQTDRQSSIYLVKPYTIDLYIQKCIYVDHPALPLWKINAQISVVNSYLPDARLLGMIKLFRSIPSAQLQNVSTNKYTIEELFVEEGTVPEKNTKKLFETIENMAQVKKDSQIADLETQPTEVEGILNVPRIDILIEESVSGEIQPLLRISFVSLAVQTTIKAFHLTLNASLTDLIIVHEQFLTRNQEPLRLFSSADDGNLLSMNCLLTSPENPFFYSAPFNQFENIVHVRITKPVAMLQVEALASIVRFRNDLMHKISTVPQRNILNTEESSVERSSSVTSKSTSKIEVCFKQFRVILGTELSQLLDVQFHDLTLNVTRSIKRMAATFILDDLYIFDLHANARYHNIMIQQNPEIQVLYVDFITCNHPKIYKRKLDKFDYTIKIYLNKMKVVLLYKYIDVILNVFNALQSSQANVTLSQTSTLRDMIEKFQKDTFRIDFDIIFNAPTIFIPVDTHSSEGIFIDLGALTLQMQPAEDSPNPLSVEQHHFIFKDFQMKHIDMNNNNETFSDIVLVKCAECHVWIRRLLYLDGSQRRPEISVQIEWKTIDITLSNDDYSCFMKVFRRNFSGRVFRQSCGSEPPRDVSVIERTNLPSEILTKTIRLDFEIQQITLTLRLDDKKLVVHRTDPNKTFEFLKLTIETVEVHGQQLSDLSYNAKAQVQHIFLNDSHATQLLDRNVTVNPHAPMFTTTIDFISNIRHVNILLESFYLWLTPGCLIKLQSFITQPQSSDNELKSQWSMNNTPPIANNLPLPAKCISVHHSPSQPSASIPTFSKEIRLSDIAEKVDIMIKTSRLCWFEEQPDLNSSCLVFDFAFDLRLSKAHGESQLRSSVKDSSVYTANLTESQDLKITYHILHPMNIDFVSSMSSTHRNIDIQIENILVNLSPAVVRIVVSLTNSISKWQTTDSDKIETIPSISLFDPKPFKDASFWFLRDAEIKQEMIEQRDILEIATGTPSHQKVTPEDVDKQEQKRQSHYSQQLKLNLKLIEVKCELGSNSRTKAVIAMCLSDLFVDLRNWSHDMSLSSRIQIELAVFNDNMLAWIPLIEPIVNERGDVVSAWYITCSTATDEDENQVEEEQSRPSEKSGCLGHRQHSLSTAEEQSKDIADSLNAKTKIHIRADHLLSITLTKTSFDLIQRLTTVFMSTYKNKLSSDDHIDDGSMLSVHNLTGYEILLDDINDVEFVGSDKSDTAVNLKQGDSILMTVPKERLSATHLPTIDEQIDKRRQEFSVQLKLNDVKAKIDINHASKRVYQLSSSSLTNWPIELLCDSHISNNHRRVVLSSIVKVCNRTTLPLVILDADSIERRNYHRLCRVDTNDEYYLPIEALYMRSSSRLFISFDESDAMEQMNDFLSFDWRDEIIVDRTLKRKNNDAVHLVISKETISACAENTDEPIRTCFHVYINFALHLINLLPVDVQCSVDNKNPIDLKPSELCLSISGSKQSVLSFIIPSYNDSKWISDPIDLTAKGYGNHNEHIVLFHEVHSQDALRMILRVDLYQDSFRASLYSPFWVVNCTDLQLEFKIDNETTLIDVCSSPFLVCPKKIDSEVHNKKAHVRVHCLEDGDYASQWSKEFSLYVVASTGIVDCKVSHDRTYMICVHITTTSFCKSKIIKLSSSTAISNKSTVDIEVSEIVSGIEQSDWHLIKSGQIIPFWPHNTNDGVMCVRYANNRTVSSSTFPIHARHRTLLRMDHEDRSALHAEVSVIDCVGTHIVFSDYQIGDAPVLLVNCLKNQPIIYGQEEDAQTQVLSAQHYVYFTWTDLFKPRQLTVSCNGQHITLELHSVSGCLEAANGDRLFYAIFHDGPQIVLIFAEEVSIIKSVSDFADETISSRELLARYIDISVHEIALSIVNDITQEDLVYMTINKSKKIWTETRSSIIKPLSRELNRRLEKNYRAHKKLHATDSNDTELEEKTYPIGRHRHASFTANMAEIIDHDNRRARVHRRALDGLWIRWGWSVTRAVYRLRINHIQIDNQLEYTLLPVIIRPMTAFTVEKPFIELSASKTISAHSKTVYFKYFKLMVRESVLCLDQGLINAFLTFIESTSTGLVVDMSTDFRTIEKTFAALVEKQSMKTKIYFDCIYLSPLKVHISLSALGTKPNEFALAAYPSIEYFSQLLEFVNVHDVILNLDFYERERDRFTVRKLTDEICDHYIAQLWKQIYVVVLGHDLLGNPFGIIRGVAHGVKSFVQEPYKGATDGPLGFIGGIATGTEHLIGSAVGGAAGAGSKLTGAISEGLARLTCDDDYTSVRNQRYKSRTQTASDIVDSGKNVAKDVVHSVKDMIAKPMTGAKEHGTSGFIKGLGKGILGVVTRPASSVANLTSTACEVVRRTVMHEEIVHRTRRSRHVGRDYVIRPATADEMKGLFIFKRLDTSKHIKSDEYIAHISCYENGSGWHFVTSKHIMFVKEKPTTSDTFEVEWHFQYKELKESPTVQFQPNQIEICLKEPKLRQRINRHREYRKIIKYETIGEARYIVDRITDLMHTLEL